MSEKIMPEKKRRTRRVASSSEPPDRYSSANIEKFWDIIGRGLPEDACWIWPLYKDERHGGTGQFSLIGKGGHVDAGRFIAVVVNGHPPKYGRWVAVHKCGDNACVNPKHIEWGNFRKRSVERAADGRLPLPETLGEENGQAVLTEEDVIDIRKSSLKQTELAKLYGVSNTTISMAQLGRTWAHLPFARGHKRVGTPDGDYTDTAISKAPDYRKRKERP